MSIFENNLILANVKNQYFLLNSEGKRISEAYTTTKPFSNGLALVERNYKWGFINEQGKEVISCEFFPNTKIVENERSSEPEMIEYPYFFVDNKCKVIGTNNQWGFILQEILLFLLNMRMPKILQMVMLVSNKMENGLLLMVKISF